MSRSAAMPRCCTLLAAAALAMGCTPWNVISQAEPSPLRGQTMIAILPLEWTGVAIDDSSESGWSSDNDAEMQREWVLDKQLAATEFQQGVLDGIRGRLALVPGAAPFTIKSWVELLKTGGPFRPLQLTLRVQILDAKGTPIEEISTRVKQHRGKWRVGLFQNRLLNGCREAGANVAAYLVRRAEAN